MTEPITPDELVSFHTATRKISVLLAGVIASWPTAHGPADAAVEDAFIQSKLRDFKPQLGLDSQASTSTISVQIETDRNVPLVAELSWDVSDGGRYSFCYDVNGTFRFRFRTEQQEAS